MSIAVGLSWYAEARKECEALQAEIERLRSVIRRIADQDATLSVQGGNVIVEIDAALTDAEREAIEEAIKAFDEFAGDKIYAAALRGLLARLGDKQ